MTPFRLLALSLTLTMLAIITPVSPTAAADSVQLTYSIFSRPPTVSAWPVSPGPRRLNASAPAGSKSPSFREGR